jgi:hypothetical protein
MLQREQIERMVQEIRTWLAREGFSAGFRFVAVASDQGAVTYIFPGSFMARSADWNRESPEAALAIAMLKIEAVAAALLSEDRPAQREALAIELGRLDSAVLFLSHDVVPKLNQTRQAAAKPRPDRMCRRAFKTDQLCALNFDQGRQPPVIGMAVDKCNVFCGSGTSFTLHGIQ